MLIRAFLALPFQMRQGQSLDLHDDHRLRRHPRRIIGQQGAGDLLQMLEPHANVKPCVDGPMGSRASKRILTGGSIAIMCSAC